MPDRLRLRGAQHDGTRPQDGIIPRLLRLLAEQRVSLPAIAAAGGLITADARFTIPFLDAKDDARFGDDEFLQALDLYGESICDCLNAVQTSGTAPDGYGTPELADALQKIAGRLDHLSNLPRRSDR